MSNLKAPCNNRTNQSCSKKKDQSKPSPGKTVYRVINLRDILNKLLHNYESLTLTYFTTIFTILPGT